MIQEQVKGIALINESHIRPIEDKVLIRRDVKPNRAGVIHVINGEVQNQATVIAVGPGKWCPKARQRIAPQIHAGDRVLISKWEGTQIDDDDPDLTFITESEVMGVIES